MFNTKHRSVLAITLAFPDLTVFYSVDRSVKFSIDSMGFFNHESICYGYNNGGLWPCGKQTIIVVLTLSLGGYRSYTFYRS